MVFPSKSGEQTFCLIENTTNLSISPSQDVLSEGHDYVNISCNYADIGFGFFNVTNLTISSVVFYMCGGYPTSEAVKYVNETDQFLYYDNDVPIVLFLSHCYNLKLHKFSVGIYSLSDNNVSHQFVVGVNLCGEINSIIPDGAKGEDRLMQMFLYFTDTAVHSPGMHCSLNTTTNALSSHGDPSELILADRMSVVQYNSDFILFLTQSFVANVHLNIGPHNHDPFYEGPTLVGIFFVNSDSASLVSFQGFRLPYSYCLYPPTNNVPRPLPVLMDVAFYETSQFSSNVTDILHPLLIHNTAFTLYYQDNTGGHLLTLRKLSGILSHHVLLSNVSLCNNSLLNAFESYSLLKAENLVEERDNQFSLETTGELYLSFENILMHNNIYGDSYRYKTYSYSCLVCFSHIKGITMTGTNYFAGNAGGTVIGLVASELAVSGNLTVMDGYAFQGGGISMDDLSTLAFEEPLVAGFYNNTANQGSAIYSPMPHNMLYSMSGIQLRPEVIYSLNNITSINISLHFDDNLEGMAHMSLFAPLFSFFGKQLSPNLLFQNTTWDSDRSQYACTTLIDAVLHMNDIDKFSSLSNGLCIQPHQQKWECGYLDSIIKDYESGVEESCTLQTLGSTIVYPGQRAFSVHYFHVNQLLGTGYCDDELKFKPYRFFSMKANSTLSFKFPFSPIVDDAAKYFVVVFTDVDISIVNLPVFQFNISDCPLGFYLKNDICACDRKLLSHGYHCDIDTVSFTIPSGYWTGLEDSETGDVQILFDELCHPNYCDSDKHDFHLTDDPAKACLGNHYGVLCGECKENYSVVFGSDTCYDHCTDVYLLTIPVYALAGFFLVCLLFALRITVATGTINGLVFYANVLGLILDQLTEDRVQNSNYVAFVRVFISLLNLDLGFPLCFHEEMTMACKVGFQFLFPIYLWSIVVILVLLSKCSVRLSELISKSSVQVLATLFYLSFSKLLSTVIVIFSSSTISVIKGPGNYTSRLVWYYDGHDYGSSTHAILLALALAFTVLFLLPCALFVTFSSLLLRFRIVNKFKPFIDAYGGPFKDKWRFWFGLRLWITILLFCFNGALQGTNTNVMFIVIIITVVLFTFLQNLVRPFKNHFVGALDLFFMVNYMLLATSFFWARGIFRWVYFLLTAVAVFITAMIVVGHMIALRKTGRAKCMDCLQHLVEERGDYEELQDAQDDMDLFAAAENRVQDTY